MITDQFGKKWYKGNLHTHSTNSDGRLSPEEVKALKFKVPGGVTTTIVGLIFLVFIIGLIGYHPDTRISLYVGFAWIVLLLIGWIFKSRRSRR